MNNVNKKYEEIMESQFDILPFANVNDGKFDYVEHQIQIEKHNKRVHDFKLFCSIVVPIMIGLLAFTLFVFIRFGLGVKL